ncbi:MAG TPA: hypothetical protein QGF70_00225, partial [Candidatus Thalassarchaeaceae archaeon]|nr:hypothetical protein [Candidatus Thalassarchaeaceae archaeon]
MYQELYFDYAMVTVKNAGLYEISGDIVGEPKITDKRWSVDLEKRIQESHYDEDSYRDRYGFDPLSDKEIFV